VAALEVFVAARETREYSGKMIKSMPGSPAFAPTTRSQILWTLSITCSFVWRRGIAYWKTQTPTVSGLEAMSPWRAMA
jgi:hypothetical protein